MTRTSLLASLALLALFARPGPAPAQCYSYPSYSYPSYPSVVYRDRVVYRTKYVDKVVPVAYPVPFTVAVPVASFLYNGTSYAAGATVTQPAVAAGSVAVRPAAPSLPTPRPKVALPTPRPKASPCQVNADMLVDKVLERLELRLRSRGAAAPSGDLPPAVPGSQASMSMISTPAPPAAAPPSAAPAGPDLEQQVASVFTAPRGIKGQSCASCHAGTNSRGGVKLLEPQADGRLALLRLPKQVRDRVVDSVARGHMPPEAESNPQAALADAEVNVLRQWASSP